MIRVNSDFIIIFVGPHKLNTLRQIAQSVLQMFSLDSHLIPYCHSLPTPLSNIFLSYLNGIMHYL